jgi:hypothetical protein
VRIDVSTLKIGKGEYKRWMEGGEGYEEENKFKDCCCH